ncbi:hypothetical protein [Nonomuraea sp. NPDC049695]|uniref:hypothetical protein n=1 Tax=Nonomuraea sp. NPDC049695 TaxID=3154734 RepID=UPI003434F85A
MPKRPFLATLAFIVSIALAACSSVVEPPLVSPSDPEVKKLRITARQALNDRLDQTVKAAALTKDISRSGLDRCRKGNDDDKNMEDFSSKCMLSLYRAYAWNGDIEALLERLPDCPGTAEVRDYWREFGGKRYDNHVYDVGDLPDLDCAGVTMSFTTHAHDDDLDVLPGAKVWDPDGGMYEPYHWAPEGTPWLDAWLRNQRRYRFLVAMEASKDYAVIK